MIRIAIIGTTKPTEYGKKTAYRIAERVAEAGLNVISGLARGIDTEAHKGCINAGGRTLAFLPSPIDNIYPPENRELANKIIENNGCILSEYPSGTKMSKYHFIARDRLQAGFSKKIIVIETPEKDGTMHTVNFANELHRDIGVIIPHNEKKSTVKIFQVILK